MRRFDTTKVAVGLLFFGLVELICLAGGLSSAAAEEADEDQIQLIVEFVGDPDRETRAIGLQYVREEVPGEAATKRFAGLLPKLSPEGQADLLGALGDRGDAAARPAVLKMLDSPEEAVRAAALRALGGLGTASEVGLLAQRAAAGSAPERSAARQSLIRLPGDEVNAAIVSTMGDAKPEVRVELLGVLAARNAKQALPNVLKGTEDPDASVRLAALGALRFLADESNTAAVVGILRAAKTDPERRQAELALLAVCSRGRQKCTEAIVAGLAGADVPSRIVLLRALARAGGAKALETVVAAAKDQDVAVRDEAVRMLSGWPDAGAVGHLLAIAKGSESLRQQVLAIRGLVRLASPLEGKPADLKMLGEVINLAKRPQEKRLVIGALGGVAAPEALAMVTSALDDPALAEEAGLAAVGIAEKMKGGDKARLRAAMEGVLKAVKREQVRKRAQAVLKSP